MKKGTKIFLSIILVTVILVGTFLIWDNFGFYYSTKSKYYESATSEHLLPAVGTLPEYKSVKYKYYENWFLAFSSKAYSMIVKYDEETYENQKKVIYEPYENINEYEFSNEEQNIVKRNLEPINVDRFSFEMYSEWYPKCIYFIGTNDKTNEIAYIYFEDTDLDDISMPYSMFINTYCGW